MNGELARAFVRSIGRLGRIGLPVDLQRKTGIGPGAEVEFLLEGDALVLKRVERSCAVCGTADETLIPIQRRDAPQRGDRQVLVCVPCVLSVSEQADEILARVDV